MNGRPDARLAKLEARAARRPADRPTILRTIICPEGQIEAVMRREGRGCYLPDNGRGDGPSMTLPGKLAKAANPDTSRAGGPFTQPGHHRVTTEANHARN